MIKYDIIRSINKKSEVIRIMNNDVTRIVEKFKEVKNILKEASNRDAAIEYLVNETKLSKEECSFAYDIIMKIE